MTGSWVRTTLVLVALLFAVDASAAKVNVVTVPFTGPRGAVPRDQIVGAICEEVECVAQSKVTRRGKPDWRKVRSAGVDLVVTGKVTGSSRKRRLTVEVLDARGKRKFRGVYRLARNGKLSRRNLNEVTEKILARAAPIAAEPVAEPETEEPEETETDDAEETKVAEADTGRGDETSSLRELPDRSGGGGEETASGSVERGAIAPTVRADRPLIIAQAGLDFIHRSLVYTNLRVPNLRTYETRPVLFAPRIHVEVYPLSTIMSGVAQGVGLEVGYLMALGLRSIDENGMAHPTNMSQFDIAARLNLWPMEGQSLMVAPVVGYRAARFAVGAAPDGSELAGLPDISYGAARAGLEAAYPIGPVSPFARFEYVHILSLGEIGSDAFFPNARGSAVELQVGAGYAVARNVDLRLGVHYTRYGLRFRPEEGATYQASGAVDQYVGGAVMARYTY